MEIYDKIMVSFLICLTCFTCMIATFDESAIQKQAICKLVNIENLNEDFVEYCGGLE